MHSRIIPKVEYLRATLGPEEAIPIAREMLEIDDSVCEVHCLLGELNYALGKYEKALGAFEKAWFIRPTLEACRGRYVSLLVLDRFGDAFYLVGIAFEMRLFSDEIIMEHLALKVSMQN